MKDAAKLQLQESLISAYKDGAQIAIKHGDGAAALYIERIWVPVLAYMELINDMMEDKDLDVTLIMQTILPSFATILVDISKRLTTEELEAEPEDSPAMGDERVENLKRMLANIHQLSVSMIRNRTNGTPMPEGADLATIKVGLD